jgi:hypothetical protein
MRKTEFISIGNVIVKREHISYIRRVDEKTIELAIYIPAIKVQLIPFTNVKDCELAFKAAAAMLS